MKTRKEIPNPYPEGHMDNCTCEWCKPKPQHTPTPWTIGEYDQVSIGDKGTSESICVKGFSLSGSSEARANAAFIVRCVNNFQPMLDALKQLQIIIDAQSGMDRIGIALAKVISQAEGK